MQISLILAHPDEMSFNHAIANSVATALCEDGHDVRSHDLYTEGFDPIIHADEIPREACLSPLVRRHCDELTQADGIIVVHPNWWGQPPAILKGWVDRVIRPGVAYEFHEGDNGEGVPVGLLKARAAIVFNTSNTPDGRERNVFGDPLQAIWKNCIFDFCGVPVFHRRTFNVIVTSTAAQREVWLTEAVASAREAFS